MPCRVLSSVPGALPAGASSCPSHLADTTVCCVIYEAQSCPGFCVTPSLQPGQAELPEHEAIMVGQVYLSKDRVM